MNDTRLRCRQSKLFNRHHPPPCYVTEDATRDRSNRLLGNVIAHHRNELGKVPFKFRRLYGWLVAGPQAVKFFVAPTRDPD